ncbi:hypothetical protein BC833DRAFT_615421 [Globomyces pollinis-pini]|nr:hypothetical protein BC833DRAFT_615421 [Globomyces pollinis-pini]
MAKQIQKVDWLAVANKLRPETAAAITSFRSRHAAILKTVTELRELDAQKINFDNYKNLKNQSVLAEAKKSLDSYKPVVYDVSAQIKVIEAERLKAIAAAKLTEEKVNVELKEMKELLVHIETARPIEELNVEDIVKAHPSLDATVEKMCKRGQWRVPGYYEKFGEFQVGF